MSAASPVASAAGPDVGTDCSSPGDAGLLGLRLGGLFGILAVSTIGVSVPYFAYNSRLNNVFFMLRAFASGVVLTTGELRLLTAQ